MICGDYGRFANTNNLLSQHARFLLDKEHAFTIVDEMKNYITNNWYSTVRAEMVCEKDCEKIETAFAYPGFSKTPTQ